MGFLNLILKIGYDGSAAEVGLRSLDQKINQHSERQAEKLAKNLVKGFAIGGATALVAKLWGDAQQQAELAKANDITIQQLSIIQQLAEAAGKSFEQYRKEIEQTGKSMALFAAQKETGLLEEFQKTKAGGGFRGFLASAVEKYLGLPAALALQAQKKPEGESLSFGAFKDVKAPLDRLQKLKEAEQATIKKMEERRRADFPDIIGSNGQYMDVMYERSRSRLEPRVNQLQQVGLMGVSQNSMIEVEREQITVLQHIDGTLEKIRENQALDPNKIDFGR